MTAPIGYCQKVVRDFMQELEREHEKKIKKKKRDRK
jgi:hypothetical protein